MQLNPDEPFSTGVKRMALELNSQAVTTLKSALGNEHEAIHTVRKNLKETRALLRLVRGATEKETYTLENLFYRNSGREISAIRDATSMIEALDKLKALWKDEITDDSYRKLKEKLIRKRSIMAEDLLSSQHLLGRLQAKLSEGRNRLADWKIADLGFDTVKPGFRKVYEQGYMLKGKVGKEPSTGNLHEWRKQGKYLMYHIKMFLPVWPEILRPLESEIKLLTDYLGDHHDLSLLEQESSRFETLVRSRRKKLEQLAFLQGRKIYALNPYTYADQLEAWWNTWIEKEKNTYTMVSGK